MMRERPLSARIISKGAASWGGSQRSFASRIEGWEQSRIGPIRQYVRLLSSLVIFSSEELAPASTDRSP